MRLSASAPSTRRASSWLPNVPAMCSGTCPWVALKDSRATRSGSTGRNSLRFDDPSHGAHHDRPSVTSATNTP